MVETVVNSLSRRHLGQHTGVVVACAAGGVGQWERVGTCGGAGASADLSSAVAAGMAEYGHDGAECVEGLAAGPAPHTPTALWPPQHCGSRGGHPGDRGTSLRGNQGAAVHQ
uniref:Proline--tRNA ligase n=1 Tax=Lygus hesperus TaxID=30085 RepID=A0A0A9ZJF1_LYGHE